MMREAVDLAATSGRACVVAAVVDLDRSDHDLLLLVHRHLDRRLLDGDVGAGGCGDLGGRALAHGDGADARLDLLDHGAAARRTQWIGRSAARRRPAHRRRSLGGRLGVAQDHLARLMLELLAGEDRGDDLHVDALVLAVEAHADRPQLEHEVLLRNPHFLGQLTDPNFCHASKPPLTPPEMKSAKPLARSAWGVPNPPRQLLGSSLSPSSPSRPPSDSSAAPLLARSLGLLERLVQRRHEVLIAHGVGLGRGLAERAQVETAAHPRRRACPRPTRAAPRRPWRRPGSPATARAWPRAGRRRCRDRPRSGDRPPPR